MSLLFPQQSKISPEFKQLLPNARLLSPPPVLSCPQTRHVFSLFCSPPMEGSEVNLRFSELDQSRHVRNVVKFWCHKKISFSRCGTLRRGVFLLGIGDQILWRTVARVGDWGVGRERGGVRTPREHLRRPQQDLWNYEPWSPFFCIVSDKLSGRFSKHQKVVTTLTFCFFYWRSLD